MTVAVMAVLAMGVLGVSSAAATIVPAKASTSNLKLGSSTFTVRLNGGEAKSCTANPAIGSFEGSAYSAGNSSGKMVFSCGASGLLSMFLYGKAYYDTATGRYYLQLSDYTATSFESPWGPYFQNAGGTASGTWVNGSGGAASTITYSNQRIGSISGKGSISIEGTFKVTDLFGGLITLSH